MRKNRSRRSLYVIFSVTLNTKLVGRYFVAAPTAKGPSLELAVSRVLFRALPRGGVIPLRRPLPNGSSDRLEIGSARATPAGLPPRSRTGLAPSGVCRAPLVTEGAVRSYRTVSPLPSAEASGGLFSVALSFESPRLAVSQHPALRSPDFPRRDLATPPRHTSPTPARSERQYNRPRAPGCGNLGNRQTGVASTAGSFIRSSQ